MNDVDNAWHLFLETLDHDPLVSNAYKKMFTGLPFIYVQPNDLASSPSDIHESMKQAAAKAMKGKRLTLSMTFVREHEALYVYRVRFLVPQQKMFCCGNLCEDCIRFQ